MSKKNLLIALSLLALVVVVVVLKKKANQPVPVSNQTEAVQAAQQAEVAHQQEQAAAPVQLQPQDMPPEAKTVPDISDIGEQHRFLKAISKNGRGLISVDGHKTLLDCEKAMWKTYKVQGLCKKAGTCVCKDPKQCLYGACFIAMDPLPEQKKPVYFIRHLDRSLIGMEPSLKLIHELRQMSCTEAINKMGSGKLVLASFDQRGLMDNLNYLGRAVWDRELMEEERINLAKKLIAKKFDRSAFIQVFTDEDETKKVCAKWGW